MNHCEYKSKIERYLDEALTESDMLEVGKHIRGCSDCSKDVEVLSEIESLVSSSLFASPPADYWQSVPKKILARLGLKPYRSPLQVLLEQAAGFFSPPSYRLAFAGALAAVFLFFVVRGFQPEMQSPSSITELEPNANASVAAQENRTNPPQENKVLISTQAHAATPAVSVTEAAEQNATVQDAGSGQGVLKSQPGQIEPIAARPSRRVLRDFAQELVPVPIYEYILDAEDVVVTEASRSGLRAMSHNLTGAAARNVDAPTALSKEIAEESDFAETLWIVQQSALSQEKKNIWLSYVAREADRTYRSMGIYNLALVLARIAEETRGEKEAQEAFDFFVEHESSLRFQMGSQRYDVKVNALQMVIDGR